MFEIVACIESITISDLPALNSSRPVNSVRTDTHLPFATHVATYLNVKNTYSVTKAQAQLPRLVRLAESGDTVAITKHDETVAYLLSRERMEAIVESLEIMANPAAMRAIKRARARKTRYVPLSVLDE